jgi:hypothetical protein
MTLTCLWLMGANDGTLAADTIGRSGPVSRSPVAACTTMTGMKGHMRMTPAWPQAPGDQARADAIVLTAKSAIARYSDYRKALAKGFKIFLPDVPQGQYYFTNYDSAWSARESFDPANPTSLLYAKTRAGGFRLIGVMYTASVRATEAELNARIPLSIARWHQHINFCKAPANESSLYLGPSPRFGLHGSITTKTECDKAKGTFYPHIFGWMVHVYPYETDPKRIWATDDDDDNHRIVSSTGKVGDIVFPHRIGDSRSLQKTPFKPCA